MSRASRPSPQPSYQPIDYVAELLAIVALVSQGVYALFIYPTLPQTIPIHFGLDGRANNYGGREWIFFPFAVALALYILLTVISRFPQAFNYPWRVTEANAPRLYGVSRRMVVWLKAEMVLLFAYITWAIVRYTTVAPGPFDLGFVAIALLVVFGTVGYFVYQMRPATWSQQ
jgi:uncharacterized membrane protein